MPDSMTLEEKLSVIDSIPPTKGIFGFEAVTEKTTINGGVLQKSRFSHKPTPVRLHKITTVFKGAVFMGDNYQDMVNKQRVREGSDPNFEASPTYCKPVGDNKLIYQNTKNGQLYLRVYLGYGATMNQSYKYFDAFGVEIPKEEYDKIKEEFLKKDSSGANQWLDKEIQVRNYKIENVTKLKRHETWIGGEPC